MRTSSHLLVYCSIAALVLCASTAVADPQIGSVVQRHFNGATGLRLAAASGDDLIFNRDVFAGETVRTPGSASTVIRFADKTQIQVGANSTVLLDKFVYDPSSGTGDAAIKFGTGVFRFITGDIKNKDAVRLITPTTSLTIRGTKFILAVAADGSTTLGVLEGAVDVAPCGGAQQVLENSGQAVQVSTLCRATSVSLGSVPTDFATALDYDVSENNAGGTPVVGRGEGSPNGNAGHQGTSGGNNDGGGGLGGGGGNGGSGSGNGGGTNGSGGQGGTGSGNGSGNAGNPGNGSGNSGGSGPGTGNGGADNGNGNGGGGTGNGGGSSGSGGQGGSGGNGNAGNPGNGGANNGGSGSGTGND
ncbi:MAG TPA: FecR family protein, partial [Dongiaceae bacterium]|nr:FecR family protein [Dongiaceae bacterium]